MKVGQFVRRKVVDLVYSLFEKVYQHSRMLQLFQRLLGRQHISDHVYRSCFVRLTLGFCEFLQDLQSGH